MIRSTALFAAVSLALIAAVGWAITIAWPEPAARRAVLLSAVVALVVQVIAFMAVRLASPGNVMAGWGLGMLLRAATLVAYGLVATRVLGLPLAPALISLVSFFFVTSLVEPVLLKT